MDANYVKRRTAKDRDAELFLRDEYAVKILRDERNRDFLFRLVTAILKAAGEEKTEFEMVDIRLAPTNEIVQGEGDVVLESKNAYYNLEVNLSYNRRIDNKNLSYVCSLFLRQLRPPAQEAYDKAKRVIQMNMSNYDQFKEDRLIYCSQLMELQSHKIRSDMIKIIDVNMDFLLKMDYTKVSKYERDSLERMAYIFVNNEKETIDELYLGDEMMKKVKEQLYSLENSVDQYLFYDRRALNEAAQYDEIKEIGIEEGKDIGRREGMLHIIEQMLKKMNIDEIHELTGISKEELEEMIKKLKKSSDKKE